MSAEENQQTKILWELGCLVEEEQGEMCEEEKGSPRPRMAVLGKREQSTEGKGRGTQ